MRLALLHAVCITVELKRTQHLIALQKTKQNVCLCCVLHRVPHSLFSKETVVVTKVDQTLVVECEAAETIFHCKALNVKSQMSAVIQSALLQHIAGLIA